MGILWELYQNKLFDPGYKLWTPNNFTHAMNFTKYLCRTSESATDETSSQLLFTPYAVPGTPDYPACLASVGDWYQLDTAEHKESARRHLAKFVREAYEEHKKLFSQMAYFYNGETDEYWEGTKLTKEDIPDMLAVGSVLYEHATSGMLDELEKETNGIVMAVREPIAIAYHWRQKNRQGEQVPHIHLLFSAQY